MQFQNYKALWNHKASSNADAMSAVDGSFNEATLRATGTFTANQVSHALDLQVHDRVFEIGCGVARIGLELVDAVGHWHGLDISENMVQVSRARLAGKTNVSLDVLDCSRMGMLADASFDKGYGVAVFIHMDKEDFVLYLRDAFRVLKPGGLFYFDHWNLQHPIGIRHFFMEANHVASLPGNIRKDVGRNQFCTPSEIVLYAHQLGFDVVLLLTDTPWIQAVLRKPGAQAPSLSDQQKRAESWRQEIDYGMAWTRYHQLLLETEELGLPPHLLLDATLVAEEDDHVAKMFRRWIHGAWGNRTAAWGPMPEALRVEFESDSS